MKGQILDFSIQTNTGVISAEDGKHYQFTGHEWRGQRPATRGEQVDFALDESGQAIQVYIALHQQSFSTNTRTNYSEEEENYDFFAWSFKPLKQFAEFEGRARRKEFWFFWLFCILVTILASVCDFVIGSEPWLENITNIVLLIPSLAVGARRLHDTGRSGWWQLLMLTIIGIIPLIIWWATDTKAENNQWGQPARDLQQ